MNPTTYFISSILIAIIVPTFLLIARIRANKSGYPENCFRESKMFAIISFIGLPIFAFGIIMSVFQSLQNDNAAGLIFSIVVGTLFIAMGVWLILIACVSNTILEDDAIYYTNIFGIQKKLEYLDIDHIIIRYKKKTTAIMEYVIVFNDRKKIGITYTMSNFNNFPRVIKNRIKRHGGNVTNIFVEKYTLF